MLPTNVPKHRPERGFTLVEMLVVLALISISSVLASPHLITWLHRSRVSLATDRIQGAMEDMQRQAIRLGKTCNLLLDGASGTNPVSYSRMKARTGCLVATSSTTEGGLQAVDFPDEIRVATNFPLDSGSPRISFSFRGHVPGFVSSDAPTPDFGDSSDADYGKKMPMIVVYSTLADVDAKVSKRCVMITSMLGLIETGIYDGSLSDLDTRKCLKNVEGTRS